MATKSMTLKTAVQHLAMDHAGLAWSIAGHCRVRFLQRYFTKCSKKLGALLPMGRARLPQSSWPPIFGKSSTKNAAMAQNSKVSVHGAKM